MSNQLLNDTELPQLIPTCSQSADLQPPCSFSQNQQKFARTSKRKFRTPRVLASPLVVAQSELLSRLNMVARYSRQDSQQFTLERNPTVTLQQLSASTVDETINESDFDCLRAGFFFPSPHRFMFPKGTRSLVRIARIGRIAFPSGASVHWFAWNFSSSPIPPSVTFSVLDWNKCVTVKLKLLLAAC